jgi:hypothetical protein
MTQVEIDHWIKQIEAMSREEMGRLWRFASTGHPVFDPRLPLYAIFEKRFKELGGMTLVISKRIGWER